MPSTVTVHKTKLKGFKATKRVANYMMIALRKDTPVLHLTVRGSLVKALASGEVANRDDTLKKLQ